MLREAVKKSREYNENGTVLAEATWDSGHL